MREKLSTTLKVTIALVLSLVVSSAPLTPAYATFSDGGGHSTTPIFTDPCGVENDTYKLPNVNNDDYRYYVNGVEAADNRTYAASGTVTIELYRKEFDFWNWKYVWVKVSGSNKSHVFSSTPCDTPITETMKICHNNQLTEISKKIFWLDTHTSHTTDVFPAGSVIVGGVTHMWAMQGTQDLLSTDCKPQPLGDVKVTYTAWADGSWKCGDMTVMQTRTKTTTTTVYVFNPQMNKWTPNVTSVGTDETQSRNLTAQELKSCEATPAAPYFKDLCGTGWDWYKVPYTKGVNYQVNGNTVTPGWHKVESGAAVTISAVAQDGYTLVNYTGPWTHDFTDEKCVDIKKELVGWLDSNKDGRISAGDKVTWKIIVTNLGVNPYTGIDVSITDPGAVLEDAYKSGLKPGKSYEFTATTTLTAQDMTVCKVTNTASFVAGFNIHHSDRDSARMSETEGENLMFQYGNFTGTSNTASWQFTCPAPQVLGDTTNSTPSAPGKVLAASTLPETLPATGSSDHPLLILVAAMAAYGAAYFLQGRRSLIRQ